MNNYYTIFMFSTYQFAQRFKYSLRFLTHLKHEIQYVSVDYGVVIDKQ